MKTITRMKQLMLCAILLAGVSATAVAQTTMYSTNWNDSFDGWTVVNDVVDSPTWDHRGSGDGLEGVNTQDAASTEWIVSPEFNFSDGSTFTLGFNRAHSDSESGQLDVYYTENWGSNGNGATWKVMDMDITNGLPLGWNSGANYRAYTKVIASTSSTVRIAFKYTSSGWNDNGTPDNTEDDINRNRVRVKDLIITTSGAVSSWPLPYSAAWASDLEDWTAVSNMHTTKVWAYKAAATAFITDGKREQDDWLISPAVICRGSDKKEVSFKAGWKNALSSNISLSYATDFSGDPATATWTPVASNIIPATQAPGFATDLMASFSYVLEIEAPEVFFAIHYAKAGDFGDSQNEIRIKNFKVEKVTSTGIKDLKSRKLKFYPNPVLDVINLEVDGDAEIKIYNIAGQLVKTTVIRSNQLNVSDLHPGQYMITVSQKDAVYINRFIKK